MTRPRGRGPAQKRERAVPRPGHLIFDYTALADARN
jgi:hypothetical protein